MIVLMVNFTDSGAMSTMIMIIIVMFIVVLFVLVNSYCSHASSFSLSILRLILAVSSMAEPLSES